MRCECKEKCVEAARRTRGTWADRRRRIRFGSLHQMREIIMESLRGTGHSNDTTTLYCDRSVADVRFSQFVFRAHVGRECLDFCPFIRLSLCLVPAALHTFGKDS